MANTPEYNANQGDLTLAVRSLSAYTVATLLSSATFLAALMVTSPHKGNEIYGVGDPEASTILSGAQLDPTRIMEIEQDIEYLPQIESIIQRDFKNMAWRDTMPDISTNTGSLGTLTPVVVNGQIASVTVSSGGSGYAGSPPTLIPVNALGSYGVGAKLIPVMSGGAIASVTVQNPGFNYGAGTAVVINTGYSEGQKYNRPVFRSSKIYDPALIYDSDISTVLKLVQKSDSEKVGAAKIDLLNERIKARLSQHVLGINDECWTGTPTDQSASYWDHQFGILAAVDDGSNTTNYAGVDRTDANNYWWRAIYDPNPHAYTLRQLVSDANVVKGLSFKGGGVDVFFVSPQLWDKYAAEEVAYLTRVETDDRLRMLGEFGFKSNVLKCYNTYVIADQNCPPGTAVGVNTQSLIFAFIRGAKFQPTEIYDQHGMPGGIDGYKFFMKSIWRLMCVAPNMNVKYSGLS